MDIRNATEDLIVRLATGLHPVRHIRTPTLRALGWCAAVAAAAAALAAVANLPQVAQRLMAAADLRWSVGGAVLTTIGAAIAAFQSALPDRRPAWALLPLPPLALWLGASGLGCLRDEAVTVAGTHDAGVAGARSCLLLIVAMSAPLCALLATMLRRSYPLHPERTAALAGLAAAAAAASLLTLFHPYDASALDLAAHVIAVGTVIAACRVLGRRVHAAV